MCFAVCVVIRLRADSWLPSRSGWMDEAAQHGQMLLTLLHRRHLTPDKRRTHHPIL